MMSRRPPFHPISHQHAPTRPASGRRAPPPRITLHPSAATVQAAVVAAAMVARADGHVAARERRSLLRLLRHHGVLARYGRAAPMALFDAAVHAAPDADPLFAAVAGRPCADLVTQAATHVALADGVTWPQEIALIDAIRARLATAADQDAALSAEPAR